MKEAKEAATADQDRCAGCGNSKHRSSDELACCIIGAEGRLSLEQGELGESSGRQGWQESGRTDSSRPAWRGWASFLRAVGSHGRFEIGEYHV